MVKDPEKTQDPAGIRTQDLLITSQHVHDSNDPQKDRQGNKTQQKEKATQHNSPKAVIFQLPSVGFEPTTIRCTCM